MSRLPPKPTPPPPLSAEATAERPSSHASGLVERRQFVKQLCGLMALLGLPVAAPLFAPTPAQAMGKPSRVSLAWLALPGAEPNPRPGVMELLLLELARNTSAEVQVEPVVVKPGDRALFNHPVLFLMGTRGFPPLSEPDRARLELYLRGGGFLFCDDCSGLSSSDFDASVRREVGRLFPREPLSRIPETHVLFRTFFLLQQVAGRASVKSYLEGVQLGEELTPVLYSRNDLTGALARDPAGSYLYECVPGGESQRMVAYKLAINLLMYTLCLNYKHDLTHVRALLNKRRGVWDE